MGPIHKFKSVHTTICAVEATNRFIAGLNGFSPRTADTKRLRKRGAIMKIYNTLTRKKEEFQPLEERVRIFK